MFAKKKRLTHVILAITLAALLCRCVPGKSKFRSHDDEDIDVARERRRVLSGEADRDVLRLENLTKVIFLFFFFAFAEAGVDTLHCCYAPEIGPVHPISAVVLWVFPSHMLGICV